MNTQKLLVITRPLAKHIRAAFCFDQSQVGTDFGSFQDFSLSFGSLPDIFPSRVLRCPYSGYAYLDFPVKFFSSSVNDTIFTEPFSLPLAGRLMTHSPVVSDDGNLG